MLQKAQLQPKPRRFGPTSFSSFVMAFRASDCALKYWCISEKSHFFRSVILAFSSDVISCLAAVTF